MMRVGELIDVIDIAWPCHVAWEQMAGSSSVRHCRQCNLNVYNLSGMTRDEATKLIADHEGRLCVRFYRRADGAVLTKDCPIGLTAVRRRLARMVTAVTALVACLSAGTLLARRTASDESACSPASGPIDEFAEWIDPTPKGPVFMGFALLPNKTAPSSAATSEASPTRESI